MSSKADIKAIIFDCFGVLVGTGLWQIFERAGGDIKKDGAFLEEKIHQASAGELSSKELSQLIADRIGISVEEYRAVLEADEVPNEALFSYIKNTLKPQYKIALLSNVGHGVIERKIPQHLRDIFDVEVLSAEVGVQKPDVKIFQLTADRLGVSPEECVFTDDRKDYLVGAEQVGMHTLLFTDFESFKEQLEALL